MNVPGSVVTFGSDPATPETDPVVCTHLLRQAAHAANLALSMSVSLALQTPC